MSVNGRGQNHGPNTEVPEPVGGGREGHGLGTDSKRVDLASDDPRDGTPGGSEEGDVDADEGDETLLACHVLHRDGDTDDGDEVLANEHTNSTNQEEATATDVVDGPERWDSHADVDDSGGDGDREGVGDAGLLEESRAVVENEVDTGELLPGLQEDTSECAEENLVRAILEAVSVRAFAEFLFHSQIGFDVLELRLDIGVGFGSTKEAGEGAGSIGITATFDEEAWRLREEGHADGEDASPDELNGDRNTVSRRVRTVLGGFIDACSEQDTDGDGPLVTLLRGGLVECGGGCRKQEGLLTDTTAPRTHLGEHSDWYIGTRQDTMPTPRPAKTRPATKSGIAVAPVCSATPKAKTRQAATILIERLIWTRGKAGRRYGPPSTTKEITTWSGQKSTEKSTSREDGHDKRLIRGRYGVSTTVFSVTELLQPSLGNSKSIVDFDWERGGWGRTHIHFLDTRNDTGVISEEDTVTMW